MIFSYGFLDERTDALRVFLDLDVPDDDPLMAAKRRLCKDPPGIEISSPRTTEETTTWNSPFVWWACINEEDGLDFNVLQMNDGTKELQATWKGERVETNDQLKQHLKADSRWDVFQLRVLVTVLERVQGQLGTLQRTDRVISDLGNEAGMRELFRDEVLDVTSRLRGLEAALLGRCIEDLMRQVGFPQRSGLAYADHGT